jgi:hypothetical protein
MRRAFLVGLVACGATTSPPPRATQLADVVPRDGPTADASATTDAAVVVDATICAAPLEPRSPLVMSVDYGTCDGRCPIYSIAVYRDGTVDYFGDTNVAIAGARVKHVDNATIAEIARDVAAIDRSTFSRSKLGYSAGAWLSTITIGTEIWYVEAREHHPAGLTALYDKLDALVDAAPGSQSLRTLSCRLASPTYATILAARVRGDVVELTVGVGEQWGITPAWKAQLFDADTGELVPRGELTIASIRRHETRLTMSGTAAPAARRVLFSPP